jgi:hypothetical protein
MAFEWFGMLKFLYHRKIMQDLWQKINKDLITAMKEKNELTLSVLRMLSAALKNKKIALGNKEELKDEQVLDVLKSEVKKRHDSVAEYLRGKRQDLVDKELAEIKILEEYLPEQMSEAEVEQAVSEVIAAAGEVTMKDFGTLMSKAMAQLKGKADGAQVSAAVKKLLAK